MFALTFGLFTVAAGAEAPVAAGSAAPMENLAMLAPGSIEPLGGVTVPGGVYGPPAGWFRDSARMEGEAPPPPPPVNLAMLAPGPVGPPGGVTIPGRAGPPGGDQTFGNVITPSPRDVSGTFCVDFVACLADRASILLRTKTRDLIDYCEKNNEPGLCSVINNNKDDEAVVRGLVGFGAKPLGGAKEFCAKVCPMAAPAPVAAPGAIGPPLGRARLVKDVPVTKDGGVVSHGRVAAAGLAAAPAAAKLGRALAAALADGAIGQGGVAVPSLPLQLALSEFDLYENGLERFGLDVDGTLDRVLAAHTKKAAPPMMRGAAAAGAGFSAGACIQNVSDEFLVGACLLFAEKCSSEASRECTLFAASGPLHKNLHGAALRAVTPKIVEYCKSA